MSSSYFKNLSFSPFTKKLHPYLTFSYLFKNEVSTLMFSNYFMGDFLRNLKNRIHLYNEKPLSKAPRNKLEMVCQPFQLRRFVLTLTLKSLNEENDTGTKRVEQISKLPI